MYERGCARTSRTPRRKDGLLIFSLFFFVHVHLSTFADQGWCGVVQQIAVRDVRVRMPFGAHLGRAIVAHEASFYPDS